MKSVLIIADELGPPLREVLEKEGYVASVVKSYGRLEEIYSELARKQYDLVIPTNNNLGPQDILEVVPEIRKRYPKIRIVLLSGYHPPDFVSRLQQSGIDTFFPSPFQVDEVVRKINDLLLVEESVSKGRGQPLPSLSEIKMKGKSYWGKEVIKTVAIVGVVFLSTLAVAQLIQLTSGYFEKDYTAARWYESWGIYTPKLTFEQWSKRILAWTPEQVHELFGSPIEEITQHAGLEFFWKYKLPLKSPHQQDVVTDKTVYVWFLKPEGQDRFYSVGIVEHLPD